MKDYRHGHVSAAFSYSELRPWNIHLMLNRHWQVSRVCSYHEPLSALVYDPSGRPQQGGSRPRGGRLRSGHQVQLRINFQIENYHQHIAGRIHSADFLISSMPVASNDSILPVPGLVIFCEIFPPDFLLIKKVSKI